MNFIKTLLVIVTVFIANATISAAKLNNNLIYNAEEVDGVKVAETVYKMDNNLLTKYMKYNYKYNENNQMTENLSQKWNAENNCWVNDLKICYSNDSKRITTEYYKWNSKKGEFILIPDMTVTMDK